MNLRGQCFKYLVCGRVLQCFDLATMKTKVDMIEGLEMALPKATPLEVMLTPRVSCKLYQE
ncbi:hypothetical protein ACSBR2_014082 [Camellia fascicularis]